MSENISRPTAVRIGLAILIAYIPLFLLGIVVSRGESVLDETEFSDLIIGIVETSFVVLSLIIAFWALATRRLWGRWLIALPLVYMIATLAYNLLLFESNAVEKEDVLIGSFIGLSPLVLVILLVSVGSNVRTYFSRLEQ